MKKKTIWAALLCAVVGFTGMLAGCSGNKQDTLDFEGVSELNLSMTMTASYVEVITNADDIGRVTDVLTAAEYTQTTEPTQDIDDAFRVQAYFEDGSMMDIFVRPNGSAIIDASTRTATSCPASATRGTGCLERNKGFAANLLLRKIFAARSKVCSTRGRRWRASRRPFTGIPSAA